MQFCQPIDDLAQAVAGEVYVKYPADGLRFRAADDKTPGFILGISVADAIRQLGSAGTERVAQAVRNALRFILVHTSYPFSENDKSAAARAVALHACAFSFWAKRNV
ncbi:hypothetical protein LJC34_03345 [Oscillospiraceae bacterium OttesenSCG-928-G22]|nr:hypothetical protein [Oscillospiraceae bacterium OttesenSCG-928-G22]